MTTWILIRASGIAAYLLLFASVAWGLISTTGFGSKRLAKASSVLIHQELGVAGLVMLVIHMGMLLVDEFVKFRPLDLFLPFRSDERTVGVAFGILAMYAAVVVVVSSWARKRVGPNRWRRLHVLATPAFALALIHGMIAGTDSAKPWMWWTYVATGLAIVFLLIVRALIGARRPERAVAASGKATEQTKPVLTKG